MSETTVPASREIAEEVRRLKRDPLQTWFLFALVCAWAWLAYVLTQPWDFVSSIAPSVIVFAGVASGYRLYKARYTPAGRIFLLSLILAVAVVMYTRPAPIIMAFYVPIIIAANAVVGARAGAVTVVLSWLSVLGAYRFAYAGAPAVAPLDVLLLYLATHLTTWLATRPLNEATEAAMRAWTEARDALLEARQRRGELYQVVRAMEEATYRIERANNELLVAQREAETAREQKAHFTSVVSHEIRGPLNLILGFSRMMALFPERYGEPLPGVYHEDVDTIYRNSQHLLSLVNDVLDLSQIEADRIPLVKDSIDIEEDVVRKTLETIRPLAERKGLYLWHDLASGLPHLFADAVRLRQALLNLLTNAIRLTERGGVVVRTDRQDGQILVSVQDTGPGIDAKYLPDLFKEFHQLKTGETREQRGSGLGLSICKHLIELHGGRIWVESQMGVGTTFHFTLPLPGSEAASTQYVRMGWEAAHDGNNTCLIVHDDLTVVRLLARHLEGYRVMSVREESDVLAMAGQIHPRVIVTDWHRAEHLQQLLESVPFDVPVIGCGLPQIDEKAIGINLVGYLTKPVAPEMVTSLMQRVEHDQNATILIVDDDPDAVRLMEAMLTTLPRPYRIIKAYEGAQALALMRATPPDIVFLDMVMPGVDGGQTILNMSEDECLRKIPVAIVSGQDLLENGGEFSAPFHLLLKRPVPMATGVRYIKAVIDNITPDYLPGLARRAQTDQTPGVSGERSVRTTPGV
ncbi:MAG: ATP-binding protein [Chloroflexi bacterium]|nr:ATP-binding protein [Chloroflexota bacterium]